LHCLRAEMPFRCKQAFPREEKCLLDLLWSGLQFQLTFWDEGIHYFLPYRSLGESTISLFRVGWVLGLWAKIWGMNRSFLGTQWKSFWRMVYVNVQRQDRTWNFDGHHS
jgi:hypothetical protein